ncbi:hypothetical protein Tco_0353210 [Tanacetum coccineum]
MDWHPTKWLWNIEPEKLEQDPLCPIGKVVINIEKTQEDSDQCSLQESQKEDMCSYEDKVNGLSSHLESIGLDRVFAEANSNQPSYGTQNDGRPHQVSGQNQTLSDSDGFHLETLESDLPKYVNPDIHIKNKAKKGLKDDIATDHSKATIDKEKRQDGCKNQEDYCTAHVFIELCAQQSFADYSICISSVDSICLLNNEEMTVINKGFAEANSSQPSYGTQKDGRPHQVSGQNQTLSDSDGFHLETLESDLPKYVNPDIHIINKAKNRLKGNIASDHSKATIDKEKRQDGCKSQEESRRSTFLRKSLDWDSAFIHNAGLLNFEELSLINRGFKKADPIQSISRARKHIQTRIGSHRDQTCSKIGDLLLGDLEADLFQDVKPDIHKLTKKSNACKATSFSSSTTENNPKVHHSVESQSNDSSKRTSSISSGTSPASRVHVAISESDFQSPPHTPCHNF